MANLINQIGGKFEEAQEDLRRIKVERKRAAAEAKKLMTSGQSLKCGIVIHSAAVACGGAGMMPIPVVDAVPISAVQISMVLALGGIFHQKITESAAKAVISSAAGTLLGRTAVKLIPGVGWFVSGTVAAALTEAIGWIVAKEYAQKKPTDSPTDASVDEDEQQTDPPISEESLQEWAQEFLKGEENIVDDSEDYDTLIKAIQKLMDSSLPIDSPLRNTYIELRQLRWK